MWHNYFKVHLPPLAIKAGQKRLSELKERLESQSMHKPTTALLIEWLNLSSLLIEQRQVQRDIFQLLEAGAASRNEATAVSESLRMLYTGRELAKMIQAQDQYLDATAVKDECHRRRHRLSQLLEYTSRCLLIPELCEEDPAWLAKLAKIAQEMVSQTDQLWPLREALLRLCGQLTIVDSELGPNLRQWLLEQIHSPDTNPWIPAAALDAWALYQTPNTIEPVVVNILLSSPAKRGIYGNEWCFIQAHAAQVAARHGCWNALAEAAVNQTDSEYVEITLVEELAKSTSNEHHDVLCDIIKDENRRVRVRAAAAISGRELPDLNFQNRLKTALLPDTDEWVVETVLLGLAEQIREIFPPVSFCKMILRHCIPLLEHWQKKSKRSDLINAASAIVNGSRIGVSANLRKAFLELHERWLQRPNGNIRVKTGTLAELPPKELAKHLSFYAYNGDDYCIDCYGFKDWDSPPKGGYKIQKGWKKSTHLWRIFFEFSHPRPDKRQGYSHVLDWSPKGQIVVLSDRLSEVTPTMVPGQRQAAPDSVDWRPELPLPAMLLHAASQSKPVLVQTASNQYTLSTKGMFSRLNSNVNFLEFNQLRHQLIHSEVDDIEVHYDNLLKSRGILIERLPVSLPLISVQNVAQNILTVDANSILHLMTFSLGLLFWWVIHAITERLQMRRWRKAIPLVVGGWGSRGKSGTERLKAAMIQGMGYSLFAKTTGCEAMMVAGIPGSDPEELFLYRPYDKASITEQRMVLKHAAQFDAQVLLWECMALNPRYVNILQNDWMKDDYTTLTNTYPDHEDIQGPTGRDVAQTISQFIPLGGHVITTEQHMTPILRQTARARRSFLKEQSLLDWRLIGRDVMALLPYNEHPRNIALVLGLAGELGIPKAQALWSFGRYVIPDIGVLKTYGPIEIRNRRMSFVNGMSANERAGFLSNWTRSGFDVPPSKQNATHQVVMFNNRADRIPRQSIFANIAAMDTNANLTLVIGTNVGAFKDSWLQSCKRDLVPSLLNVPKERLPEIMAKRLRVVPFRHDEESLSTIESHLEKYGQISPNYPHEKRRTHVESWLFKLKTQSGWSVESAIKTFTTLLNQQFIVINDPKISGDDLIELVAVLSPESHDVRIMGVENIKGTGLDFVYRWLSIANTQKNLADIETRDGKKVQLALRNLAGHRSWGRHDLKLAMDALQEMTLSGYFGTLGIDTEAAGTLSRLRSINSKINQETMTAPSIWQRLKQGFRHHFDIVDSFRRVKEAEILNRALVSRQIGIKRAALESKTLLDRQK